MAHCSTELSLATCGKKVSAKRKESNLAATQRWRSSRAYAALSAAYGRRGAPPAQPDAFKRGGTFENVHVPLQPCSPHEARFHILTKNLPLIYLVGDPSPILAVLVGCYLWNGDHAVVAHAVLDTDSNYGPPLVSDVMICAPLWQVVI